MINKDQSINNLLNKLRSIPILCELEIVDNWEADLCAIGLKRNDKMVYVSTFNYVDQIPILYDYDLELLNSKQGFVYNVIKESRGITEKGLLEEINSFLF
jgi:hypothetical protein